MYHSYKAHITGKAQPSCSLIPTSKPCQRELLHGIDKFPSWYWSSAVQLEMFLNLPCRLRPANSSSKQMQMNATYMAGRISSHVFQNVYMNSKHVSSVHSSSPGQWSLISAFQTLRSVVTGQAKNEGALIQKCDHWGTHAVEWWLHVPFLSPFPWIVKVLHLHPQKVHAAIIS